MTALIDLIETSGFPLSLPTGLALETLFTPVQPVADETREVTNIPDLSIYNLYIFNVSTLLRNIVSSIKSPETLVSKNEVFLELLKDEVDFLRGFFTDNNVPIAFYINTHAFFKTTYPLKLRKATTDKQLRLEDINNYCLSRMQKEKDIAVFHKDISFGKDKIGLVLTHTPVDLLSYGNFSKLDLLESHTGTIKQRKDWNTKYYPIPRHDMSFLPFMEYLLVTFGDKVMFTPSPMKEREELHKALKTKGVNALTSEFSMLVMSNKRG